MNDYEGMTNDELSALLVQYDLPHSGTKAEMIARLEANVKDAEVAAAEPEVESGPSPVVPEGSSEPSGGTAIDARADAVTAVETPAEERATELPPDTPEAPVIEEPHEGEVLEESLVKVSGTAVPSGATVTVWADARAIGQASVDNAENWSLEASLPNGDYDLTASVNDSGRVGPRNDPVGITVNYDSTTPVPDEPSDPDEAFALFLRGRVLRGYPLNWQLVMEIRAKAEAWLEAKQL